MPFILVTGGAGYIGSHVCKTLIGYGFKPVVFDNLITGHRAAVKWGPLEVGDIGDEDRVAEVLRRYQPQAVMHFAASAEAGESVRDPSKYYRNNVAGTLSLLDTMKKHTIKRIIFSSTCATYGIPEQQPITEQMPQNPINPYGMSKLMVERILADYVAAYDFQTVSLRYFNAAGADPEGEIGEDHNPETHLIPRGLMAVTKDIPYLELFGTDYPTPDGTCIRDYVHVTDLAIGHVNALRYLIEGGESTAFNLGSGHGFSVRQIIESLETVTDGKVPLRETRRRPGDPASLLADISRAQQILKFDPQYTNIDQIVSTAWQWHRRKG